MIEKLSHYPFKDDIYLQVVGCMELTNYTDLVLRSKDESLQSDLE